MFLSETLEPFHKKGLEPEMDGVGPVYSPLNAPGNISFGTRKIDGNFFDKDIASRKRKMIFLNIIPPAEALGTNVIAEGAETDEQEQFILYLGCDTAHGYNFSKPAPFKNFEENIKSNLWVIEKGGI